MLEIVRIRIFFYGIGSKFGHTDPQHHRKSPEDISASKPLVTFAIFMTIDFSTPDTSDVSYLQRVLVDVVKDVRLTVVIAQEWTIDSPGNLSFIN